MKRSIRHMASILVLSTGFALANGSTALAAGEDCRAQIDELRSQLQKSSITAEEREKAEKHLTEAETALGGPASGTTTTAYPNEMMCMEHVRMAREAAHIK